MTQKSAINERSFDCGYILGGTGRLRDGGCERGARCTALLTQIPDVDPPTNRSSRPPMKVRGPGETESAPSTPYIGS